MTDKTTAIPPWLVTFRDNVAAILTLNDTVKSSGDRDLKTTYKWLVTEAKIITKYLTGSDDSFQIKIATVHARTMEWLRVAAEFSMMLNAKEAIQQFQNSPLGALAGAVIGDVLRGWEW